MRNANLFPNTLEFSNKLKNKTEQPYANSLSPMSLLYTYTVVYT